MSSRQLQPRRPRRWRRVGGAAALTAAVVLVAAVPGAPADTSAKRASTITISGSTSVAPLTALLAQKYHQLHQSVGFRLSQGGSDVGVSDVAHGRVSIGASSRDIKSTDPGGITFNKIARDAICVITNNDNHLPNLSQNGVQAIFGGNVRHWNDVPGATRGNNTIDVFVRTAASGTQDAFQKIFMDPVHVDNSIAKQLSSNGLIQQKVKSDKDGVGYVSLFFAKGTHAVAYKGVQCNLRNAKSGQYGGVRNFWYVTRNGHTPQAAKQFINWVQNSSAAEHIVASNWVPLH